MSSVQLRGQRMDSEATRSVVHFDGNFILVLFHFLVVVYNSL